MMCIVLPLILLLLLITASQSRTAPGITAFRSVSRQSFPPAEPPVTSDPVNTAIIDKIAFDAVTGKLYAMITNAFPSSHPDEIGKEIRTLK